MKRLLSLTLAAALLAALTLPAAAAEESQDARLARVTSLVKEALSLDTDSYETFHGSLSEDLVPVWDLNWEGERRSLSVQALEDGTVVSLYRWESDSAAPYYGDTFPSFPESGRDSDRAAAENFLTRVLRKGEAVELKEQEGGLSLGDSSRSAWSGTITLNGLPSPLHYSIRVEGGLVGQFSRDLPETSGVGGVPAPEPSADAAKAREDLAGTLKLRLEYVRKDEDAKAVLRYVPEAGAHEFLADARTGALIDLTELEEQLRLGYRAAAGGANAAAPSAKAEMAADEAGLTQAELEGVVQLEGVLSKETLDKALRAESAYGLRGYALTGASYQSESGENGEEVRVLCTLRYARTDDGERLTRNITVDAKTGDVDIVWSSAPYGREKKLTEEEALKRAEAFLKALCPDRTLALYEDAGSALPVARGQDLEVPYYRFRFARTANGLPFPENSYQVAIDAADGSVYSLSYSWDKNVTFDDANGLVSMETALAAWAGTYETVLAYRSVPQKLVRSDPAQAKLMEQDVEYCDALRLTYGLEREDAFSGVDAKTGAPVREERGSAREPLSYDDLAGTSAKADIEKLARYGAGYAGGKFRPGKSLTQWELVALVYSLRGGALEPEAVERDGREDAYWTACRLGLLRPAERDDNAVLSRADVARMLLDAAGYGPAARLSGIYTCGYSDKGSIPAEGLGYAAIAEALGLASGVYAGTRTATRGEAASMLCRVLERAA